MKVGEREDRMSNLNSGDSFNMGFAPIGLEADIYSKTYTEGSDPFGF